MKYLKIIVVIAAMGLFSAVRPAFAQGTAFTYQGRLNDGANPAAGTYDLRFTIYDSTNQPGVVIVGPLTNSTAAISNGLFTVTLDFGAGVFTGPARWLEIGVRTNGGTSFATLAPRQPLTPTPYAIMAGSASNLLGTVATAQLIGTIPSADLSGPYNGTVNFNNGANVFDGSFFGTFFGSSFTGGIFTGQFIGDGSGLANLNASQLVGNVARTNQVWLLNGNAGTNPNTNFIGTTDNQPLIIKVNGLEAERFEPTPDTPNVVGGYSGNYVQPGLPGVTIGGGGTGLGNQPNIVTNNGFYATIAGGYHNTVTNYGGAVLGGSVNFAGGSFAVIGGGQFHTGQGDYSFIGGGIQNTIQSGAGYSAIVSGSQNSIQSFSGYSAIASGFQNSIQTNAGGAIIGGGYNNSIALNGSVSSIVGGLQNSIRSDADSSLIGGGQYNSIAGSATLTVAATIGGGYLNTIQTNTATCVIGGGYGNVIQPDNYQSVISGGYFNTIQPSDFHTVISGGALNQVQTNAHDSVIAGGYANIIQIAANNGVIGGGYTNTILANAQFSTIGGGVSNSVAGTGSTVPGGFGNTAGGMGSFAAGTFAQATNDGAFVLTDDQPANFYSTASNQLSARFTGGVRFVTGGAGMTLDGQPVLGGTINAGQLSGAYTNGLTLTNSGNSFAGNGTGLTNVNAALLNGQPAGAFAPAVGSTNYIQNQSLGFQNASFQISGSATVGGAISGSVLIVSNVIASGTVTAPSLVVSNAQISGLLRSGSETGAGEAPNPAGLVVRRINSTVPGSNTVVAVARTFNNVANIILVRDGNNGGFQIKYPASPGNLTIACMGIDTAGTQRNFYASVANPGTAGLVQIYSDAQNIVHFECTFGITFNTGQHLTQVTLSRYGATLDNFWSGNLVSTWNQ